MDVVGNFLAVDLGASSGRVVWGRWDGQNFALQELHRFLNTPIRKNGHLHWEVNQLWDEIKKGLALYPAANAEPLTSIGVDSWAVDYVLLNRAGQLLELPYHYRDQRTEGAMEAVIGQIGKAALFAQTGLQLLPFNTLYQLYSQQQDDAALLQEAATFLMIPDWFHYRLSGQKAVEYTNATTTQFFAVKEKRWNTELLGKLGIPAHFLPPVIQPGTVLGELLPELAQTLGLQQENPILIVTPGTHDTASAVAGVPELDEHTAYISSGTWSLVGVEIPEPLLSPQALQWNFTNEGGVANTIRLLKNVSGLWLIQECQREWKEAGQNYSWSELVKLATVTPAFVSLIDPDAPDFLNPPSMNEAIRAYCGRTGQVAPQTPGAFIRCCLESLALKYRVLLEQLETLLGHSLNVIRVVGGGSQNELLCQFTAEACAREVIAGPVEATALGNIILQAIATNQFSNLTQGRMALAAAFTLKNYRPSEELRWAGILERFQRLV